MDSALGVPEQAERAHGAFADPLGQRGPLNGGDQVADVPVRGLCLGMPMGAMTVAAARVMGLSVVVVRDRLGGPLLRASRQYHVDLGCAHAAAIDRLHSDRHLRRAESGRQAAEPIGGCSCGDQCTKQHVAADSRGRVEDGKTSIRHRLINMAEAQTRGKSQGSR